MDVLTDVLNALELKGCITTRQAHVPPWRYHFVASQDMIFHLLSSGSGYLSFEGDPTPPMRVEGGGVLLFPCGHAHAICDKLTSPLTRVSHVAYSAQSEFRAFPETDEGSKMVCSVARSVWSIPESFPGIPACQK